MISQVPRSTFSWFYDFMISWFHGSDLVASDTRKHLSLYMHKNRACSDEPGKYTQPTRHPATQLHEQCLSCCHCIDYTVTHFTPSCIPQSPLVHYTMYLAAKYKYMSAQHGSLYFRPGPQIKSIRLMALWMPAFFAWQVDHVEGTVITTSKPSKSTMLTLW